MRLVFGLLLAVAGCSPLYAQEVGADTEIVDAGAEPTGYAYVPFASLPVPTKIMIVGDSITIGNNVDSVGTYKDRGAYREHLIAALEWRDHLAQGTGQFARTGNRFLSVGAAIDPGPSHPWQPAHEGHSGWPAWEARIAISNWVKAAQPDVVVMMFGINDYLNNGHTPEQVRDDLAACVDLVHITKASTVVYVVKTPPVGPGAPAGTGVFVMRLGHMLNEIVRDRPYAYALDVTPFPIDRNGVADPAYFAAGDSIHLSPLGAALVGRSIAEGIQ